MDTHFFSSSSLSPLWSEVSCVMLLCSTLKTTTGHLCGCHSFKIRLLHRMIPLRGRTPALICLIVSHCLLVWGLLSLSHTYTHTHAEATWIWSLWVVAVSTLFSDASHPEYAYILHHTLMDASSRLTDQTVTETLGLFTAASDSN